MSNTRHAESGSQFRQERFASSAEYDRGLLGNLVAKRTSIIGNADERALVWWLQWTSWQPGGLAKMVSDLVAAFPERAVTKSMQTFGIKHGQNYDAEKVKVVREEICGKYWEDNFDWRFNDEVLTRNETARGCDYFMPDADPKSAKYPTHYPVEVFTKKCRTLAISELPHFLSELCLDPQINLAKCDPRYFVGLVDTLREFKNAANSATQKTKVVTEIGRKIEDTLEYCFQSRCMVLIDGLARTGKTHAARSWCDTRQGQARYVQVPSSNDDIGFFRAIASALGVSINQNSKAHQLRDRIEDVLQGGGLMLVMDESHFLWPQGNFREKMPGRISWLMTALVNNAVPVALISTQQFLRTQKTFERSSAWSSEQFVGRIGHYEKLPNSLPKTDLQAIARYLLPEGCAKSIQTLVAYAQASAKYLAGIDSAIKRARYLAAKANRQKVIFQDIRAAIKESVIPSDAALALALAEPKKTARGRAIPAPINGPLTPNESRFKPAQSVAQNLAAIRPLEPETNRANLAAA